MADGEARRDEPDIMFGENGVALSELDEFQLSKELRSKDDQYSVLTLIWFVAGSGLIVAIGEGGKVGFQTFILIFGLAFGFLPAMVHFASDAKENERLPKALFANRIHKHVTGFGAFLSISLVGFVFGAATVGHINHDEFVIPEWFGLMVLAVIVLILCVLILAPRITDLRFLRYLALKLRSSTDFLGPIGSLIGTIDSWLVLIIAPLAGAEAKNWRARYALIFGNLILGNSFAWFAPPPIGFAGVAWTLLVALSIVRRWAWIENDRESNRGVERARMSWRTGDQTDLRDEALWALLFLIASLPIAMREVHLSFAAAPVFDVHKELVDDPIAWLGLFGVEMVKAIPFIDWSDIYQAVGDTRIGATSVISQHAIFAVRIVIDLMFVAAIVQAITISLSLSRQKRAFLARDPMVTSLDERIEKSEISRVAQRNGDSWKIDEQLATAFTHYDTIRLSVLRRSAPRNSKLRASIDAIFQRASYQYEPPQIGLVEESARMAPDPERLLILVQETAKYDDLDLELLEIVRRQLLWKPGLEEIRRRLGELIVNRIPASQPKLDTMVEIASGPDKDSLASVRVLTLRPLQKLARRYIEAKEALKKVALSDSAPSLRRRARILLNKIDPNWSE